MVQVNRVYLKILFINRPQFLVDSNVTTYIDGKHYRCSTHLKVYPNQWNSEKQLAVISNVHNSS